MLPDITLLDIVVFEEFVPMEIPSPLFATGLFPAESAPILFASIVLETAPTTMEIPETLLPEIVFRLILLFPVLTEIPPELFPIANPVEETPIKLFLLLLRSLHLY